MKIAVIIVRVLMGLLFLFSSVTYLFNLIPVPPMEGDMKTFSEGLAASGYLMTLIKVTELICSLALISGFFVPLALVILFPIIINIFFVHLMLAPEGMPVAIFLLLASLFLAYAKRDHYKGLLAAK
ncbi:DoxX family membrane protein [Parachryseolinea silvisoli]|jgi:putative oxidoreductase|uniref:DoxX family membrane protein n=1 Tax=Parachryseolinea silvisoli TaxID=2873601 RepID=UPI002265C6D8|nr:DoxX family membrane protein [Parachryseolinea silvisoli]MCD9017043.1 DoxX family membrane protein [Parachryseolinea silvisoli]